MIRDNPAICWFDWRWLFEAGLEVVWLLQQAFSITSLSQAGLFYPYLTSSIFFSLGTLTRLVSLCAGRKIGVKTLFDILNHGGHRTLMPVIKHSTRN
jgi:hypothetical protein